MKLIHSLSVLAVLSVVSLAARAQAGPAPVAVPVLLAEADSAAVFSSSIDESASAAGRSSAAAAAAAAPHASEGSTRPFSSLGIGVKVGTIGIGFDAAVPLVPGVLNLRGGAGFFSYNDSFVEDGSNLSGTLKLNNSDVMVDVFPFRGSFRLSAGVTISNDTSLNATLTNPGGSTFTLGNSTYTSSSTSPAHGTGAFKFGGNTVPRFTLGWGNMVPRSGHLKFETELGIQYISQPTVTYVVNGLACPGSTGTCVGGAPVAPSDVAAEQAKLQNDLNGLRFFPVLSIGLSYKIH